MDLQVPFFPRLPTKADREREKNENIENAILSKLLSSYVSNTSNICYGKCIDSNNVIFSNYEKECIKSCVNNMHYMNEYMFNKFSNIIENDDKVKSVNAKNYSDLLIERRKNII